MSAVNVSIIDATGNVGRNIVNALLGSERDTSRQVKLIDAASKVGVKRLVLDAWAVTAPPNDIMIRDWVRLLPKIIYAYMKKARVPYKVIDTGDTPCATTALQAIGRFVASIISDPQTLNRYVFAYGEHVTQNQHIALAREITREDPETANFTAWQKVIVQYLYNNWVKRDTETFYAKYLGYLDAHGLMRERFAGGQSFAGQGGNESFWIGLEKLLAD
ncbi:hypothetical protein BDW62DRAFT_214667 [Aspergillus aurantiobrunneus]